VIRVPEQPTSDKRLELAYNAAEKWLTMQDATLTSVRTRANTLLATAALFTSFSAGIGLINTDPSKGAAFPTIAAGVLLLVIVALGACVGVVNWPARGWVFVPSAPQIMERYRAGQDEAEIREWVIDKMISGAKRNATQLGFKQKAFRAAALLLAGEVALLVLVVFLSGLWSWLSCLFDGG
jgi:hypothetical protein